MARTTVARRLAVAGVAFLFLSGAAACGSSGSSDRADDKALTTTTTTSGEKTTTGAKGGTDAENGVETSTGKTTQPPETAAPTPSAPVTSAPTTSDPASGDSSPSGSDGTEYDGPGGGGPCTPDPDRLSGTATVMWTADSGSKRKDREVTAETTMLFQADGSLEPSTLTVKVNEVFAFGLADGVSDIVSVKVGCDGGQTVFDGPPLAAEYITKAGTYDIVNLVAEKKVGTITVE